MSVDVDDAELRLMDRQRSVIRALQWHEETLRSRRAAGFDKRVVRETSLVIDRTDHAPLACSSC